MFAAMRAAIRSYCRTGSCEVLSFEYWDHPEQLNDGLSVVHVREGK